jgi:DNA-binding NarL/FixJ family response regulator
MWPANWRDTPPDDALTERDTVKGHVRNILSKLDASDRTRAVTNALQRGFFDL